MSFLDDFMKDLTKGFGIAIEVIFFVAIMVFSIISIILIYLFYKSGGFN